MISDDEENEIIKLYEKGFLSKSYWDSFIGIKVSHNKLGSGKIVGIEFRPPDEPLIQIKFSTGKKGALKEFSPTVLTENFFSYDKNLKIKIQEYIDVKAEREKYDQVMDSNKAFYKENKAYFWNQGTGRKISRSAGIPGTGKRR